MLYKNTTISIISRAMVSFSYGYLIVILPLYLLYVLHYPLIIVGSVLFAAMLLNSVMTFILGMAADHYGRKYVLMILYLVFAVVSLLFLYTRNVYLITLFAGIGSFTAGSTGGPIGSGGPFGAVQNAVIAEEIEKKKLPKILGYAAIIEMMAAMAGSFIIPLVSSFHFYIYDLFYVSAAFGFASFFTSFFMKDFGVRSKKFLPSISYRNIANLSIPTIPCGLGSGMILPVLAVWLEFRYHSSASTVGTLFGIIDIAVVLSLLLMPRVAKYVGRLKIIVISRVFASLSLIAVAFSPIFLVAAGLLVLRGAFAMGAVPVRQSFVMTNVHETERASTNGATSLNRNSASAFGPLISGFMLSDLYAYIPLVGGIITMADPILYFVMFKDQWNEK